MVRLTIFLFALLGFCSCQKPIVSSSSQSNTNYPYNTRTTQYSVQNRKPYGSTQTQNKNYGSTYLQSKYYQNTQNQRNYYGNMPTQGNYKAGNSMKKWGSSYSQPATSKQLQKYKGSAKENVEYKTETFKTKPSSYRLKSVGRTLIGEYLETILPWNTCTTIVTNLVNSYLFNPSSVVLSSFLNAGIGNWCGNRLHDIIDWLILSPYKDKVFESLNLSRD